MNYPTLFVGIDISKHSHYVATINEQKKVIEKPFKISDSYDGYQSLSQKLNDLVELFQTEQFFIGIEATGDYWKNIYYFLKQQTIPLEISIINPIQTRALAKTELRRAKTDAVDAKDIALFMAEKRPAPYTNSTVNWDIIKDIDKQIFQFKKIQTMTVNKLRIELTKVAPEIETAFLNIQGKQIMALLNQFPTAEFINKASFKELKAVHYGDKNWALPDNFIDKIKKLSQNSIAFKKGIGSEIVIRSLIRMLNSIHNEVGSLKQQLVDFHSNISINDSILATIPGVSNELAIILEAYINDVNRFSNVKQFVAYFGMNPSIRHSGKYIGKSHLQKKGQSIVRHKLFLITLCMIANRVKPVYTFYKRLVDDGKPKLVAVGAAMRKVLVIIFYMLKNNESFKF